ncbi:MAG TPA: FG-GAP-like repeat-containing protein, partial [Gammaproteobacteria bacterium]|nr:FG-GAP-like repeat-containing protein [Gammaproteobacteria bacterium]
GLSGVAGSVTADLVALNKNFGSVGLDTNGDGVADEAARFDWSTFAPDVTPTPTGAPEADLGPTISSRDGEPVTLNGRYSHSQDGSFVHFQWMLAMAPAGSTATLENAATANPTLTPDRTGDYLVRLGVSNASGSSSDATIINASSNSSYDTVDGPDAGPNRNAALGSEVALDGRGSTDSSGGWDGYQWYLYTPEGSQAVLDSSNGAQPSFTPDVAGYYYASLGSCCDSRAGAVINVNGPVHLGLLSALGDDLSVNIVAVGDLNNDGLPDLVINGNGAGNSVLVIYNRGGGRFSAPAGYTLDYGQVAIGDINGDGLADLVTGSGIGIGYRLQQTDGTLGPLETVAGTSTDSGYAGVIIAKLYGESRNSVVAEAGYDSLTIYGPIAGGAIGNPVQIAVSGVFTLTTFAVGDVTGDGISDLLAVNTYPEQLLVLVGHDDGTFSPPAVYPLTSSESSIVVGDVNGDGRNDVILKVYDGMIIMLQQSDGTLGSGTMAATRGDIGVPAIADINGDGRNDILFGESFDDPVNGNGRAGIGMFIQQPDGSLSKEFVYPINIKIDRLLIADMNGDGTSDVVTTAFGASGLRLAFSIPADAATQSIQVRRAEVGPSPPKHWQRVKTTLLRPVLPRAPMQ